MNKSTFLFILFFLGKYSAGAQPLDQYQQGLLDSMTAAIESNSYTGIHSVLISRGGKLAYERYFNGWGRDSLHDTYSSFKSVASLLTGIAIDRGLIRGVNEKVYPFFPEYASSVGNDDRKKGMTIKNLLEMESGFDCEEFMDSKDCEDVMDSTNDWIKFSLDLPMKNNPGTVWAYTSCNPMIVGGIISRAAKMSIMDFAKKYLFDPMGIRDYRWTVDPKGQGLTAGTFFIRPVDMLKIGEMVRQKGVWKGKRIVSEAWLAESTNTPIPIPDFSFVKYSRSEIAIPQPAYYGYYWYTEEIKTRGYEENVLFASGNGGQYIMIIKNLGLVVVFTQGNVNSWKAKRAFDILAKYILPAYERGE